MFSSAFPQALGAWVLGLRVQRSWPLVHSRWVLRTQEEEEDGVVAPSAAAAAADKRMEEVKGLLSLLALRSPCVLS